MIEQRKLTEDRVGIHNAIWYERDRQDEKWGEQNHDDLTWLAIFTEEVGEVAKACIPQGGAGHSHGEDLEKEIVHALAVGVAWLEARARRRASTIAQRQGQDTSFIRMGCFKYRRENDFSDTRMGFGGAVHVLSRMSGYDEYTIKSCSQSILAVAILRALKEAYPGPQLPGPTPAWEELMEAIYVVVGECEVVG